MFPFFMTVNYCKGVLESICSVNRCFLLYIHRGRILRKSILWCFQLKTFQFKEHHQTCINFLSSQIVLFQQNYSHMPLHNFAMAGLKIWLKWQLQSALSLSHLYCSSGKLSQKVSKSISCLSFPRIIITFPNRVPS